MPYYRKTYRRRTFRPRRMTRKRVYRRKFRRTGARRGSVYYFKRRCNTLYDWVNNQTYTTIGQATGNATTYRNFAFRLQDVPGYTDWTGLYDAYRIRAVKVNFIPVANTSVSYAPVTGTGPILTGTQYCTRMYSAFDPNADGVGITGPNALTQIMEYQNSKWTPYNRIHKRYIKPKVMLPGVAGSAYGYNLAGKQPWIQCSDGGLAQYYGLPVVIEPSGFADGSVLYKIEATFYMQFARPK